MDKTKNLPSQEGRIIIVTGANTGLGFETALFLAAKKAAVILACRNIRKAEDAKIKIEQRVSNAKVDTIQIDLSSLKSVRNFANEFKAKYDRLDILINNAGVMMPPYSKTEDGFELQLGANYLGHFLLTGLLLDLMIKTPASRIVSLSSLAHRNGSINFEDLQSENGYSASEAYGQSKLACLMFAFELQRRLELAGHTQTISTAAHPGIANTELVRHMPKVIYTLLKYTVAPFITHEANEGAKPTILAAIGNAKGGDYFGPTGFREMKGSPGKAEATILSKDKEIAKRLWEESEKLVDYKYL
ncbi:MAG: SDR family NAD(P)-dependent oxidoreductase [Salibacteraceae bacterium]